MEEAMPDERWWRRGLVIGTGVVLALALLAVTAVAAGLTWTDPVTVSTNSPPAVKVDAVDMALAGDGSLQAVWVEKVTDGTTQFNVLHASATYSAGAGWTWSDPDTVLSDQYSPASLAVDGSNRLHVTYPNNDKSSIRFSRGTWDGSSWSWVPSVLNSPPNFATTQADTAGWPVIAVSGSTLHVVWAEIDDGPYHMFQIVHGASTDWGDTWPQELTTEVYSSTRTSQYPDMVVGQDGKLHVAWEEGASTGAVIYYTYGTPSGNSISWSTPITVSGTMTDCHRPSIAIVGDRLYVAWGQTVGDKTNQDVYYSTKLVTEGTWPTPTKLPNSHIALGNTAPTYVSPRILATSSGRVVIVWDGYVSAEQNGKEDIYFSETADITDSGAWTERVNVSSNAGASYGPTVVLDDGGVVHVMWIDSFSAVYSHSQYQVFLPLVLKSYQ
ncbi:MAG: hypothetical protein DRI80_13155 [Chloroflexota bacterium]|nr:MAG: hypothetical protein DRI80_13155 [Chloroflexota bacterium]